MSEEQNSSSTIETTAKTAKTVADGVKTAKEIGQISAKIAAGNYAGAAIDAVKSEGVRNLILICIACFALLIILFTYAIPSMMFGGVAEYVVEVKDILVDAITSSEYTLAEAFDDIAVVSKDIGLWAKAKGIVKNFIKSVFGGMGDKEVEYGDADGDGKEDIFYVTNTESSAIHTIKRQAREVVDLFDQRKEHFKILLSEIHSDFEANPPEIAALYDEFYVESFLSAPDVSTNDAIQYISHYSIQRGNGMDNITLRSLLAWIGYTRDTGLLNGIIWKNEEFWYEGRKYLTYRWEGDYLPQYLYEQRETQVEKGIPLTSYDPDSFLEQIYFIADDGMRTQWVESERIEYDEEGEPYTVTILTMKITMIATLLNSNDINDNIMGFWEGELHEGINRSVDNPDMLTYAWTLSGIEYTRLSGYQIEYWRDQQLTTKQYVGSTDYSDVDIDYSIIGGLESETQAGEDVLQIAIGELGTIGGFDYCGNNYEQWCAYFVRWCARQAGLTESGEALSKVTPSCETTWKNYGGVVDHGYFGSGSVDEGTAIAFDDTVLGGGQYIPQRGDLVLYCSYSSDLGRYRVSHIGYVETYSVDSNDLYTIEGNTGSGSGPADRKVLRRNRTNGYKYGSSYKGYNIVGFIRPNYPADADTAELPAA